MTSGNETVLWRKLSRRDAARSHIDSVLGRYKSDEFIGLINRWAGDIKGKRLLKTDLREEAFGEDEVLFSLSAQGADVYGIDISEVTVDKADSLQKERKLNHNYVVSDVRDLPFEDDMFDIIISSSTLDHFESTEDLLVSLRELKRVLKPQGNMIITLNNRHNINFFILLKIEKFLGLTKYPVQFFSIRQLRKMFGDAGLIIVEEDFVVHIISPVNTILKLMGSVMRSRYVHSVAMLFLKLASWLGRRKTTKRFTGWFIALQSTK